MTANNVEEQHQESDYILSQADQLIKENKVEEQPTFLNEPNEIESEITVNHESEPPTEEDEAIKVTKEYDDKDYFEKPKYIGEDEKTSANSLSISQLRDSPTTLPEERLKFTLKHPLKSDHTCPQCNEAMRYPVQFSECKHRVCSACFHEFFRTEPRCPVDQGKINREKAFLDKSLTETIMKLEILCNFQEWGCKWEGTFGEGQSHFEKCDYTNILCNHDCGAKFQRRFLQRHLDKDCPKKIISCAFCEERCLREEKKAHLEDCQKVPLPCPNKCDKKLTIPRDELDNHIEVDCPRTKVLCQFEEIGCPHRCSRERLQKHNKTGIIAHVRLLYDVVMKQSQRLDQHHELLHDHGALLEAHQALIDEIQQSAKTQLVWRIEEFSRKMKEAKSGNVTTLFSPPFHTSKHGYRMCASLCLNGDGKGKGTHISVFVSILKGAFDSLLKWPFDYRIKFYLLDQNPVIEKRSHKKFNIKPNPCQENLPFLGCPKMEKNASFGAAKFCKQSDLEDQPTLIKDDVIYLKISCDCGAGAEF